MALHAGTTARTPPFLHFRRRPAPVPVLGTPVPQLSRLEAYDAAKRWWRMPAVSTRAEASEPSEDLLVTAVSLRVDAMAADTYAELRGRQIDSVLLKGGSFANWLYRDGPPRCYTDADFLVSPDNWVRAREALSELGFVPEMDPLAHPGMGSITSEPWVRGEDHVDLHCTIWGLGASPELVWHTLSQTAEPMRIGGSTPRVLAPAARAMHLALHVAQHGDPEWKPATDLKRAIAMLPDTIWTDAAALAQRLQALPAFATGLRLVPEGQSVAARLGLERLTSADAALRVNRTQLASGFEQLARTDGGSKKLRRLLSEIFPTPAFMRWWSPLARKGPLGLAAAYVWRLLWMTGNGPPGYLAYRRARAQALESAGYDEPAPSRGTVKRSAGGQRI